MYMEQAKNDYITTDMNLNQISKKYQINYSSLRYYAKKENWEKDKNIKPALEKPTLESDEQRQKRILELSDMLLDKIEKSIAEIDRCIIKTKEKTKTVEYDCDLKKPINESVEETENIEIIDGMIDKMGIKQLVSTLKDIKDIHLGLTNDNIEDDEESGVIILENIDEQTLEAGEDISM